MPLTPPTDTAVDLECAWLNGDPAVIAYLPDGVERWVRDLPGGTKAADLRIESSEETRVSIGRVQVMHQLVLRITWPTQNAASTMQDDQAYLAGAVRALVVRIRGLIADHTHGGAFASAADTHDGNARGITIRYEDPSTTVTENDPRLIALIRYGVTEDLIVA